MRFLTLKLETHLPLIASAERDARKVMKTSTIIAVAAAAAALIFDGLWRSTTSPHACFPLLPRATTRLGRKRETSLGAPMRSLPKSSPSTDEREQSPGSSRVVPISYFQ